MQSYVISENNALLSELCAGAETLLPMLQLLFSVMVQLQLSVEQTTFLHVH